MDEPFCPEKPSASRQATARADEPLPSLPPRPASIGHLGARPPSPLDLQTLATASLTHRSKAFLRQHVGLTAKQGFGAIIGDSQGC